jgi:D-3-phosphoglycerate dehydrogenase
LQEEIPYHSFTSSEFGRLYLANELILNSLRMFQDQALKDHSKYFIIDFDSTFTQVEALDELVKISLAGRPEADSVLEAIRKTTKKAMDGDLSFAESLRIRVSLLGASRQDLEKLVVVLKGKISDSFLRNRTFFETFSEQVYIVSSGFKEFIVPIVADFGIEEKNVFANTFLFDDQDRIVGFDETNFLSQDKGKVKLLKELQLPGEVYVLGDGYTDYEIKEAGLANKFFAFTENVERESVVSNADHTSATLDEFLYDNRLPMNVSYPKSRISVLLLENIHPHAVELFRAEGYQVESIAGGLDENELCEKIKNVSILGIRSKTMLTARVLEHANKLISVGAFCIGTNQIDLETCLKNGIAVFNAPYSNTRSVVELAVGEMILLTRRIVEKSNQMHGGKWDKSAKQSYEVRGKKLGIIGYGNIGTQLSVIAEALGMQVFFYDTVDKLALGNAQKCHSLNQLLETCDIITIHADGRKSNANLIGEKQFARMKDGVIFLNLARGHLVDIQALAAAIKSGKVRGAGLDVFPEEPKTNHDPFVSELQGLPNVLLSPHIGGSTEEAQFNIADYVPNKMMEYINTGSTYMSVNFPEIQLPELANAHRLIHCHANVPGILARINQILANHNINIMGQYLKTNAHIGYVITDIDKEYNKEVIRELKAIESTIKFRVLY